MAYSRLATLTEMPWTNTLGINESTITNHHSKMSSVNYANNMISKLTNVTFGIESDANGRAVGPIRPSKTITQAFRLG
jgi:hypothetical protein